MLVAGVLVMIAEFGVAPEKQDAFLAFASENLEASRSYDGNIAFDILVDDTRPGVVVFYEVWESAEAQQAYMAWRIGEGDLDKLLSYMKAPPKFMAYRRVGTE
jgi:quinol monooxygenase YgiN